MMAMAVDRGLLHYGDKIAKYWPEFAQNGKGEVSMANANDVIKTTVQLIFKWWIGRQILNIKLVILIGFFYGESV